jgi:hypothetical protein
MVLLVTAAELASYLQVPEVDTASAEQAIRTASGWVESKTGVAFTPRTSTLRLSGSLATILELPVRPVTAVTAVTIDGTAYTDFSLTAGGQLYRELTWRTGFGPQVVAPTVKYGCAAPPDDIKGVVLEMSGGIYDGRLGVRSEQIDDYRIAYSGVLSPTSLDTLASYGADVGTLSMTGR